MSGEPPLLETDEDPEVHHEALNVLRERDALDDRADLLPQSVYDDAAREARRRLARGGRSYAAESDAVILAEHEFDSQYADGVDRHGLLMHRKAEVILAAAGRKMDEESYLSVLHVIDSEEARRVDESELGSHLANAEALSDAAEHELYVRGVKKSDPDFEALYICEIESLARESGVFYDPRS